MKKGKRKNQTRVMSRRRRRKKWQLREQYHDQTRQEHMKNTTKTYIFKDNVDLTEELGKIRSGLEG